MFWVLSHDIFCVFFFSKNVYIILRIILSDPIRPCCVCVVVCVCLFAALSRGAFGVGAYSCWAAPSHVNKSLSCFQFGAAAHPF